MEKLLTKIDCSNVLKDRKTEYDHYLLEKQQPLCFVGDLICSKP